MKAGQRGHSAGCFATIGMNRKGGRGTEGGRMREEG